jgi:hypothetical protein
VSNSETYRVRFRFRLQKKLNIKDKEYQFQVGAREVVLSPLLPDLNICDSEWLVMNTRGFEREGDAEVFARKLKSACEVSSVSARLGIDTGTVQRTEFLIHSESKPEGRAVGNLSDIAGRL